jgi:hypothetical protein
VRQLFSRSRRWGVRDHRGCASRAALRAVLDSMESLPDAATRKANPQMEPTCRPSGVIMSQRHAAHLAR